MRKLFRNKFTYIVAMTLVCAMSLAACGNKNAKAETESKKAVQDATESTKKAEKTEKIALSDGTYTAEFTTDSSMFHVNDVYDNKGTLIVKDGKATIHVTLTSTHIVNLFLGTAKDASKDKAELLEPTVETVDYGDGTTEEVNAFVHHKRTWRLMGIHNTQHIIFALMVRIHHVSSLLWQVFRTGLHSINFSRLVHQINGMLHERITLFFRIALRMICFCPHSRNHIWCTMQIHKYNIK